MRGVLVELPSPCALKALMDRGERDRELSPTLPSHVRDGEWLTLTVRVGPVATRLPARVRELGETMSLVLSERDWENLRTFSGRCSTERDSEPAIRLDRLEYPPSGVTAVARGRVFVLAQEACLAKVIAATLASAGFDAIVSSSPEDLMAGVKQHPTNVIILDGQVPDTSTDALCRQLHEMPLAHRPYVLVLVASSSPSDAQDAMTSGADDFLLTPFRRQELLARITSLLHRAICGDMIGAA